MHTVLPESFYQRHALVVARELLGHTLVRTFEDGRTITGRIVETEAYTPDDPSCHAHRGTSVRARSMFEAGGIAYVYLIYGMYHCLNVVTQAAGEGAAVLIRAVEPLDGVDLMLQGRKQTTPKLRDLARGPGRLCQAFWIDRQLDGSQITQASDTLHIIQATSLPDSNILQTPRIGINASPEAIAAPWRLIIANNKFISGTNKQNRGENYYPTSNWFQL